MLLSGVLTGMVCCELDVKHLTLIGFKRKLFYMTNLDNITDPEDLLDAIVDLTIQRQAIDDEIKKHTIRAVHHLGARRISASKAAGISRPTLNVWLDEYAERAGDEWDIVG